MLGHVSVGKTTVLNALFQDYFSEVSRRRTTAGVNFFRIVREKNNKMDDGVTDVANSSTKAASRPVAELRDYEKKNGTSLKRCAVDDPLPTTTALSILTEITADNKKLRQEKMIQEKTFHIQLPNNTPVLVEMHENTTLVFVEIPGLNEADTKRMYLDYVTEHWDTFDCVMIVMDAEKGVNTEEEVQLLKFAKNMMKEKKCVPLIILCNKVDDPDDDSLMELVTEVQVRVEKIFDVTSRTEALDQLLTCVREGKRCSESLTLPLDNPTTYPIFIPFSAGNAFAYRTAANCSFEKFKQLDSKLIDKLGCDEVGRAKWKKMSRHQKCKIAFDAVSNATQFQERLETTNFDKVLSALCYTIGGSNVQRDLIVKQIEVALRIIPADVLVAKHLLGMYDICKSLNRDASLLLKQVFWKEYKKRSAKAYRLLTLHVDVSKFNAMVDELMAYSDFVHHVGWVEEERKIVHEMIKLVDQQIGLVLEKEREWKIDHCVVAKYKNYYEWQGQKWVRRNATPSVPKFQHGSYGAYQQQPVYKKQTAPPADYPWHWKPDGDGWRNVHTDKWIEKANYPFSGTLLSWSTLTYHDWVTISSSLLLLASNFHFCFRFGNEKTKLETLLMRHRMYANGFTIGKSPAEVTALENLPLFTEGTYVAGKFSPKDPIKFNMVVQVVTPKLLSDVSHWGYLIWKFCELMDEVDYEGYVQEEEHASVMTDDDDDNDDGDEDEDNEEDEDEDNEEDKDDNEDLEDEDNEEDEDDSDDDDDE